MAFLTLCFALPLRILTRGPLGGIGTVQLLGFGSTLSATGWAWLLAAVVVVVFCAMTMRAYPLIRRHVLDVSRPGFKAAGVLFGATAGMVEEVWFRRVPMDWAAHHGAGALYQVALSALLFALPHAVWGAAARSVRVLLGSLGATALLGAALAVVYLVGGRVLAPCIWAHMTVNAVLEPWLFVAAVERGLGRLSRLPMPTAPWRGT